MPTGESKPQPEMDRLFAATYEELRSLADHVIGPKSGRTPTLQATALVHEAYVRLCNREGFEFQGRPQFMSYAAKAMRNLIVDYARQRRSDKRGGKRFRVELEGLPNNQAGGACSVDLMELDAALEELADLNPRQCTVAELRFLVGLSIEESAAALELSPMTIKNDWRMARAWLLARLSSSWE